MARTSLQTIRNTVLAIGVCASLAAGSFGLSGRAEARVPEGDRVSASAVACGNLQDYYDYLISQIVDASEIKRSRLRSEIEQTLSLWESFRCQDWYGSISFRRIPSGSNIVTGVDTASPGALGNVTPATGPRRGASSLKVR